MTTEIERTAPRMRQPNPNEVLQGIATMQAFTIGLLLASHIGLTKKMRRIGIHQTVIFAKDAKGE